MAGHGRPTNSREALPVVRSGDRSPVLLPHQVCMRMQAIGQHFVIKQFNRSPNRMGSFSATPDRDPPSRLPSRRRTAR